MRPGKVPPELLQRLVFTHLGKEDSDIILGPGIGEDASVIQIDEQVLIAATDPITGSVKDVGWLAVHVNANDIATFGVQPRWFLTSIMLPPTMEAHELEQIMNQIDGAARSLGISVAGGHTEITEGINRPIIAGFMLGLATDGKYVTSSGAHPGDALILTKSTALEGTAILATEGYKYLKGKIDHDCLEQAKKLRENISVVKEGLVAFETGYVTAMHDPTEGGLVGAIHELCEASSVGCRVILHDIPVHQCTRKICEVLSVNYLELISSGAMLIACGQENAERVISAITKAGIDATQIGTLLSDSTTRVIVQPDGSTIDLVPPKTDALWDALKVVSLS